MIGTTSSVRARPPSRTTRLSSSASAKPSTNSTATETKAKRSVWPSAARKVPVVAAVTHEQVSSCRAHKYPAPARQLIIGKAGRQRDRQRQHDKDANHDAA